MNSPVQAPMILSGRSAGYDNDDKSQPRMGLNTNALHVNIQPLQGCNLLVHFNHRLPPAVIHSYTPAGVNLDG